MIGSDSQLLSFTKKNGNRKRETNPYKKATIAVFNFTTKLYHPSLNCRGGGNRTPVLGFGDQSPTTERRPYMQQIQTVFYTNLEHSSNENNNYYP